MDILQEFIKVYIYFYMLFWVCGAFHKESKKKMAKKFLFRPYHFPELLFYIFKGK